jgi:1-acyl-sn-glycerol-3-phosphate acyltransferase
MKSLSWFLYLPLNVLQAAGTIVWGAFWISVALVARFLTGSRRASLWLARRVWAPGQVAIGLSRVEVAGRERISPGRAYLVVANHQSWLDIPTLFVAFPGPLHFLAKKELARVPFLGWYIEAMGMVFVDRADRRRAVESVDRAGELLASGASLASFPEGTRSLPGTLAPFRAGGFGAAIAAGAELLPVAIDGAGKVLPRDGFAVRPGVVRVTIGEPISTAGMTHDERGELARRAEGAIATLLGVPAPSAERNVRGIRSRVRREEERHAEKD